MFSCTFVLSALDTSMVCFIVLSWFTDLFVQHLDTELDEEDVQKITSGCKSKTQITVHQSH